MANDDLKAAARKELARRELARRELAQRQSPKEEQEGGSWLGSVEGAVNDWRKLSAGIGVSGLKTYYGMKDLIGMGEESDKETLNEWKRAADGGWGTAGQLVGDVGQLAVPGGLGVKGARLLQSASKAPKLSAALPGLADVGGSAGLGYVQLPGEGETRKDSAIDQGAYAFGGRLLAKTLGLPLTGVRGTPAGERLREAGAKLTPGQIKEGLPRRLESISEYVFPSVSKAIRKQQDKSLKTTLSAIMQKAAPPTGKKVKIDSMAQLNKLWDDAYEEAWPSVKVITRNPQAFQSVADRVSAAGREIADEAQQKEFVRIMQTVRNTLRKKNAKLSEVDTKLRKHLKGAQDGTSKVWDDAIQDVRSAFKDALPEKNRTMLQQLDANYGKKKTIELAHDTQRGLSGEMLEPKDMLRGVRGSSTRRARTEGVGNLQQEARDWKEVVGPKLGFLPTGLRRGIQAVPDVTFGGMGKAADMVSGNFAYQKAIRDHLRQSSMPYWITPARAAGAYAGLDEEEY